MNYIALSTDSTVIIASILAVFIGIYILGYVIIIWTKDFFDKIDEEEDYPFYERYTGFDGKTYYRRIDHSPKKK